MGEDARLTDFGGSGAEADSADERQEVDGVEAGHEVDATEEVERGVATREQSGSEHRDPEAAVPICRWIPDGRCDRCGTDASRRWRTGEEFVCPDCVDWT